MATSLPEYEGYNTISVTPIYDTNYKVIWLEKETDKEFKVFFIDTTATSNRLREPEEVPEEIRNRPDVINMLKSPPEAEYEHAKAASRVIRAEEETTNRFPTPSAPPPELPPPHDLMQTMAKFGESFAANLKLQPAPDIDLPQFELCSDTLVQTRSLLTWLKNFELKLNTKKITDPDDKLRYLHDKLGSKIKDIIDKAPWTDSATEDVYTNYVNRTKATLMMKNARHDARSKFDSLQQKTGDDLRTYYNELSTEAELCEFPDRDERILYRMIAGTRDDEWRRKVIARGNDITLAEAMGIADTLTSTRVLSKNIREREHPVGNTGVVHYTSNSPGPQHSYRPPYRDDRRSYQSDRQDNQGRRDNYGSSQSGRRDDYRSDRGNDRDRRYDHRSDRQNDRQDDRRFSHPPNHQSGEERYCQYCMRHHKPRQCPAWDKRCRKCNNVGHFENSKICRGFAPRTDSAQRTGQQYSTQNGSYNGNRQTQNQTQTQNRYMPSGASQQRQPYAQSRNVRYMDNQYADQLSQHTQHVQDYYNQDTNTKEIESQNFANAAVRHVRTQEAPVDHPLF